MDNALVRPARLSDFEDLRGLYLELTGGQPVPEGAAGRERLAGKVPGARGFCESLGFDADDKWGMILRPGTRAAA